LHVGEKVETDTATIGTIARKNGGDPSLLSKEESDARPDITLTRDGVTSVWEIKPAGKEHNTGEPPGAAEGRKKALGYVTSLNKTKPGSATLGSQVEPGTTGLIPAKGGAVRFWSPEPGVILYKYEQQRRRVPRVIPVPAPEKKPKTDPKKQQEKKPEKTPPPLPVPVPVPVTMQAAPEQPPVQVAPPVAPPPTTTSPTTPPVAPAPAPKSGWGTAVGVGLLVAGAAIVVGTVAADVLTAGASIADDPASFAAAGALFARGAALAF
jgi:hypothetical protein